MGDSDTKLVQVRLEASCLYHSYHFTRVQTEHVEQVIKSVTKIFVKSSTSPQVLSLYVTDSR